MGVIRSEGKLGSRRVPATVATGINDDVALRIGGIPGCYSGGIGPTNLVEVNDIEQPKLLKSSRSQRACDDPRRRIVQVGYRIAEAGQIRVKVEAIRGPERVTIKRDEQDTVGRSV